VADIKVAYITTVVFSLHNFLNAKINLWSTCQLQANFLGLHR